MGDLIFSEERMGSELGVRRGEQEEERERELGLVCKIKKII